MVDPAGPRTRAQFARESESRSRALEPGPGRPGYLVDPAGPGTRPRSPGLMAYQAGHRTLAQVARESWSIPWALRNQPESPGTDGGPRGPWDTGPGCPGQLVDPPGTRSGVGAPGPIVDPVDPQTRARVTRECWWISQSLGPEPESPGTPCRPHMLSEQGPSRQGYLVEAGPRSPGLSGDPTGPGTRARSPGLMVYQAGPRTLAQVARESGSTP